MTATPTFFLTYINPISPSFFIKSIFFLIFTLEKNLNFCSESLLYLFSTLWPKRLSCTFRHHFYIECLVQAHCTYCGSRCATFLAITRPIFERLCIYNLEPSWASFACCWLKTQPLHIDMFWQKLCLVSSYHVLLDWFIHHFNPQNGICI